MDIFPGSTAHLISSSVDESFKRETYVREYRGWAHLICKTVAMPQSEAELYRIGSDERIPMNLDEMRRLRDVLDGILAKHETKSESDAA